MDKSFDYFFLESAIKANDKDVIKEMIKNKEAYADIVKMKSTEKSSLIQLMAEKGSLLLFETFLPCTDLSVRDLTGKSLLMSTCTNWNWGIQSLFWEYIEENNLPYSVWGGQMKKVALYDGNIGSYDDLLAFLIVLSDKANFGVGAPVTLFERVELSDVNVGEYLVYFGMCRNLMLSGGISNPLTRSLKYADIDYDKLKHPFLKMMLIIDMPLNDSDLASGFSTVTPILVDRLLSKMESIEIEKSMITTNGSTAKGLKL